MYSVSDYWFADGKLHFILDNGGEGFIDMERLDLQRTVDENQRRGLHFELKANPGNPGATTSPSSGLTAGRPEV